MSNGTTPQGRPPVDVDALIAEIRKNLNPVESMAETEVSETGPAPEPTLYADLQAMCDTFSGGHWPSGGLVGLFRKVVYRLLGLKEFNGRTVSFLTKLISLINGTNAPESGEILGNQRRTIDLLVQLVTRLDRYDNETIVERLAALEKQAAEKK